MKITGIIIGLVGLVLLALGGYLFVKERLFLQTAEPTLAVVTENKRYTYTGQVNEYGVQHYYCSEFRFQTKNNQKVSFEEPGCAELDSPPDYKIGQTVEVVYDPADPGNTVQLRSEEFFYAQSVSVAGALVVLLGTVLFWAGLLRRNKGATHL
jgi:hypothetical protein